MIRLILACFIMECSLHLSNFVPVAEAVDGTLMPGYTGVNVVVGVIEKLDASKVFMRSEWYRRNTLLIKGFLRHVAYAETEDGNKSSTGGIWNLSENDFTTTQVYVRNDTDLRQRINSSLLQTDWLNIRFDNLSVPLYSGLAILLRLDELLQQNSSTLGINRLRQLWLNHFRGNPDRWTRAEIYLSEYQGCTVRSDIVFVVDVSNSITRDNLTNVKDTIYNFTNLLVTDDGDNRIGIILIKTAAEVYLPLTDGQLDNANTDNVLNRIDKLPYEPYEYTNTADALCKLTTESWRDENETVLQMAIVFSDGRSNYESTQPECKGDIVTVANIIHTNRSDILVHAVGIGSRIDHDELNLIASRSHLVTELRQYNETSSMKPILRYEVCYTLSESVTIGDEVGGAMARGQIMRWVLEGIGGDGVTIRLCVREGKLTLYVSHFQHPSEAVNENQETVTIIDRVAVHCSTYFENEGLLLNRNPVRSRREEAESKYTTLYISIVGLDDSSVFTLQTAKGNFTFDTNECNEGPYPCHESATCHNTDGSYYCECKDGFIGNGVNCTATEVQDTEINNLVYILPIILIVITLLSLLVVMLVVTFMKRKREGQLPIHSLKFTTRPKPEIRRSDILQAKQSLKKPNFVVSAKNPLAI